MMICRDEKYLGCDEERCFCNDASKNVNEVHRAGEVWHRKPRRHRTTYFAAAVLALAIFTVTFHAYIYFFDPCALGYGQRCFEWIEKQAATGKVDHIPKYHK